MKAFVKGFFVDDTGASSMMRGVQFFALLITVAIIVVILIIALNTKPVITEAGVIMPADTGVIKELTFLVIAVFGIPTTGKFIQSFAERNITTEQKTEVK